MRYWIIGILLVLVLAACSSPVAPPLEPSEAGSPQAQPTPEPTEVISPPVEPTSEPTSGSAAPLLDEEIIHMHPSEVDNTTLPITAVEDLHRTGRPQDYDINTYRLVVEGLVESPLSLSYEDLLSRPQASELVLLICRGVFSDNAVWTGTPLKPILEEAGISSRASHVRFVAGDEYTQTMPLEEALAGGVFLAYEVNGEPLPPEHGYPIRLVVRHQYGSRWVKWLERIEILEEEPSPEPHSLPGHRRGSSEPRFQA
jgi:DMSO/TMAO reductase YedYZ molybdopterin-dependent catalytic subunit